MNAEQERVLRAWLDARDPGEPTPTLRAALQQVPANVSVPWPASIENAMRRALGPWAPVRLVALVILGLALTVALVGASLLLRSRVPFPPQGLIAYTVPTGISDVRLIAADGSGVRAVTDTADALETSPRWSPDGSTLLFVRFGGPAVAGGEQPICGMVDGSIVLYDLATRTQRDLATGLRVVYDAEWTPSGTQVGFLQDASDCKTLERGVIDLQTGRVTISDLGVTAGVYTMPGGGRTIARALIWTGSSFALQPLPDGNTADVPSSDGRRTAVAPLARDLGSRLEIVDRVTGDRVDLGPGSWPAWSPDNAAVAFVQPTNEGEEVGLRFHDRLAVADLVTERVRIIGEVLVTSVGGIENATPPLFWTRDGQAIYFLDDKGGHVVDVASGSSFDLPVAMNGCLDLQWQPTPKAGVQ